MWHLGRDRSRSYLGRSRNVPVSKHLRLKGGASKVTCFVLSEVSRGRSTDLPMPMETGRTKRLVDKEICRTSNRPRIPLESQLRSIGIGGHCNHHSLSRNRMSNATLQKSPPMPYGATSLCIISSGQQLRFEPPSANPHARWRGSLLRQLSAYPDRFVMLLSGRFETRGAGSVFSGLIGFDDSCGN